MQMPIWIFEIRFGFQNAMKIFPDSSQRAQNWRQHMGRQRMESGRSSNLPAMTSYPYVQQLRYEKPRSKLKPNMTMHQQQQPAYAYALYSLAAELDDHDFF